MMIYRIVTAWVVAATMLLCPFLCLANAATPSKSTSPEHRRAVTHACACCPASGSQSKDKEPCERDSGSQGGTCLCHGAVMDLHAKPIAVQAERGIFFLFDELFANTAKAQLFHANAVRHPASCHFVASADRGRGIRALIESLLI
jgi:hypothetical protein